MPGPVFLEGEQVELRTVQPTDYEFILQVLNDPSVRHGGYETYKSPVTKTDVTQKVEGDDYHMFLVCRNETPAGSVALKDIDLEGRKAELQYLAKPVS